MSDTLARTDDPLSGADRRATARQAVRSLAYVALDEGNGGIILNLSEGGLSVQAVTSLMDDFLPGVRFQLSETDSWIETQARITWASESRKLAGLEFVGLSDESRGRIREWLNRESGAEAGPESDSNLAPADAPEAASPTHAERETPPPSFTQPFEPFVAGTFPAPAEPPVTEHPEEVPQAPSAFAPDAAPPPSPLLLPGGVLASPAEPKKANYLEELVKNHWSVIILLASLALASLVAGWAAGQGALGRYAAELHLIPAQLAAGAPSATLKPSAPSVRPAFIEVVSAPNLRWTIPFDGPLNSPADPKRRELPAASASEPAPSASASKPDVGFRTWILTPPSQSPKTNSGTQTKLAPPELGETPNPSENVLTPAGGLSSRAMAAQPALAVPAPSTPTGVVKQAQLIYRVDPPYPEIAKEQHSEGTVRLNVTVGPDGVVRAVTLLGGPRLLIEAAEKAVRQWRYTPTLLDGKPVEFQREVDLTFRLSPSQR